MTKWKEHFVCCYIPENNDLSPPGKVSVNELQAKLVAVFIAPSLVFKDSTISELSNVRYLAGVPSDVKPA